MDERNVKERNFIKGILFFFFNKGGHLKTAVRDLISFWGCRKLDKQMLPNLQWTNSEFTAFWNPSKYWYCRATNQNHRCGLPHLTYHRFKKLRNTSKLTKQNHLGKSSANCWKQKSKGKTVKVTLEGKKQWVASKTGEFIKKHKVAKQHYQPRWSQRLWLQNFFKKKSSVAFSKKKKQSTSGWTSELRTRNGIRGLSISSEYMLNN